MRNHLKVVTFKSYDYEHKRRNEKRRRDNER